MDGTHDLGGKQGFGPIPIDDNEGFHHDWERRMWAMARSGISPPGMTIDWFRHGLERMVPSDYLSFSYFEKWCANYFMLLIDANTFSMSEALDGHMKEPSAPRSAISVEDVLLANRRSCADFTTVAEEKPKFSVGESVTTKRLMPANHTRLPAYARGATGTVITHHGTHLLPDTGAQGVHQGEHLYTVAFGAVELWGDDANPNDSVTLELWESYFV